MTLITLISYFLGVWASLYLTDLTLRFHPCTKYWYTEFTARLGLSFDVLQARFFTQRLNNIFIYVSRFNCVPWTLWFSCGVIFSALFMVLSILLLSLSAYNTISRKPIETQVLTPVMPGINLPINHLGFYLLTLLLCAFLHEAGHALAAVCERVRLHGFGLFIFGLYPGAYVDLNSSDLQSLSPFSQLRVYCAGVWHNAVIALLSVVVFYLLPVILSPAYDLGTGVGITYLREDSVVTGTRGLFLGDAVTRINSCPVNKRDDWYSCLREAYANPSGYCVSGIYLNMLENKIQGPRRSLAAVASPNKIHIMDENGNDNISRFNDTENCCANYPASTHLCFTYLVPGKHGSSCRRYACLPARAVTERTSCNFTSDCGPINSLRVANDNAVGIGDSPGITTRSMFCVIPSPPDNSTRLVRLVHNRQKAPAILFLGPLDDLISSVGVSDYVPRWPNILSPNLPSALALLCTYFFSLSGALVILNVIPCYALDGQWIFKGFLDLCFSLSRRKKHFIFLIGMCSGSFLLIVNFLLAIIYLYMELNVNSTTDIVPSR